MWARYTVGTKRGGKRGDMAIPWTTAFYIFRKVLPVVIDKAPDLLKT
jgi:hypothetical protein